MENNGSTYEYKKTAKLYMSIGSFFGMMELQVDRRERNGGKVMKRTVFTLCAALFLSFIFSPMAWAIPEEPDNYIGLHDRLLKFNQDEIHIVEGKTFVPFEKLMGYLYADTVYDDKIYSAKNDHIITYDYETGKTTADGQESDETPIRDINGELHVDVAYVANSFGFHFEYFPELNISRIFSDSYKSLKGPAYEKHMNVLLNKINPPTIPIPEPVKPLKANVYLTFDDGPNNFTTTNLATLKTYNVQSTFFFLGKQMNAYPSIVKEVAKDGHYIGSHSMTHEKSKVYASTNAFMNEMSSGAALIKDLTDSDPILIRAPYGSKPHVTKAMKNELKKQGYKMWDWDVDSNDWEYSDKQYAEIIKNVRVGVDKAYKSGDRDIVVLLHDRSQTAKALPQIIEWLQKEGYTLQKYDPAHHVVQNFHLDTEL